MVLLLPALLALAACGQVRDRSLCPQYQDFQAAAAQVQQLDPQTATIDDIRAASDDVLDQLDQFQWASDGSYDELISNLRSSLIVLRESAVDLQPSEVAVARPLLQDSWDDVVNNYQLLTQRLDVVCPTD
jgi:hypothetical protein